MKWFSYVTIVLLTMTILLVSILSTFFDDGFYAYGYRHNNAFDILGEERVTGFTEDWQLFLEDKADLYSGFTNNEQAHLQDVKELYKKGKQLLPLLFILLSIGLLFEKDYFLLLRRTVITSLSVLGVFVLLSLRWDWFFTLFHKLFFAGNWKFFDNTLMMQLWGGNFFVLAALYIGLKIVFMCCFLYVLSYLPSLSNDEC